MDGNRFAIGSEEYAPSGCPSHVLRGLQSRGTQPLKQRSILMQQGNMLRQGFDVSDLMHEPGFHVVADLCAGLRSQRHTPAAHGFSDHQPEAFLDARQHQNVALAQQVRHVVAVAEHLYAGMRQHRRQFFLVGRQEFSRDQKGSVLGSG